MLMSGERNETQREKLSRNAYFFLRKTHNSQISTVFVVECRRILIRVGKGWILLIVCRIIDLL